MKRVRDSRQAFLIIISGLIALVSLWGCEKDDPAAEALLQTAVGNTYTYLTDGEVKVSFDASGTTVTPWYRIVRGTSPGGQRIDERSRITNRPLTSGPVTGQVQLSRNVRGALSLGAGAFALDNFVAITHVDTFIQVHRVQRATPEVARLYVAGRRVVHLTATPRNGPSLAYDVFIDAEKPFVLGIEERNADGRLLHAMEYQKIQYLPPSEAAQRIGGSPSPIQTVPLDPQDAARTLGIDVSQIFPQQTPVGFPHRELIKTGALTSISLRFTNGTSTGTVVVFVRKPRFENIHFNPITPSGPVSPDRDLKDLILSGKAFVDGQFIGVTYEVKPFSCVELHTSKKSILILSIAGLDVVKETVSYFPLP